ncbi:MAG: hypothetical protein M1300_10780 [Epsilonproteobacteria bacterium]|nr:hypothetical protein [Campylobacterota bacterium]
MKPYNYFPIDRQKLADAMVSFAHQKPGFDRTNYYSESSYKSDYNVYKKSADENRRNLRNPQDIVFHQLSRMDDKSIHDAFITSYSGRLSIQEDMSLEYTAGQYWCTEYQEALASVVDRIGDMAYAGLNRERFYDVYVNGENKIYGETDLCHIYKASLSADEKLSYAKLIWGETTSDGWTEGGARKMVNLEDYSRLNSLLERLDEILDERVGYAIEGLRNKGFHFNGSQEVERMYELTHENGNKEILNEYDFNQRAQELTGLSSSKIDITIKAMTALRDRAFKVEKLEYFPKFKCYTKLEDQSVKTIAPDGKRWTDATKKAVTDPQFKEALMLRFGDRVAFLNDPSIAMKVMGKEGTLSGAVEELKKGQGSPELK